MLEPGMVVGTSPNLNLTDSQRNDLINQYSNLEPGMEIGINPAAFGPTAEQIAQTNARNSVYGAKDEYMNQLGSNIDQWSQGYGNSVTDYLDSRRAGQQRINTLGARNELAKNQGQAGVLGMVNRGIKSSGVMLANRNAGDSSAAGALAGAYGQLGSQQMANVGNQYALGNEDIMNQQTQFNATADKQKRDIEFGKQQYITSLMNDVNDKMTQLNAQLADASLPDRIAIEQEKQAIRDRATQALQGYDQNLGTQINPNSIDERRTEAQRLQTMGTDLGAGAFNFTDQAPMQFQGNAPSGGGLPIFTMPRRRMA